MSSLSTLAALIVSCFVLTEQPEFGRNVLSGREGARTMPWVASLVVAQRLGAGPGRHKRGPRNLGDVDKDAVRVKSVAVGMTFGVGRHSRDSF